jgi:hypothetical protein
MTATYKTDDSFFYVVAPMRCAYSPWFVYKWFFHDGVGRFRAVRDQEAEESKFTLADIEDLYPGVKSIGLVMDPWARAVYAYKEVIDPKKPEAYRDRVKANYPGIDLSSFTKFIMSLTKFPMLPQRHWLYNGDKPVDYLLRVEHINEDFKPIQDYFCSTVPLGLKDYDIGYKSYFTKSTREIIQKIFAEDIDSFGYTFKDGK